MLSLYYRFTNTFLFYFAVSRLHCESESFKMDLILDINSWLYPMELGEWIMRVRVALNFLYDVTGHVTEKLFLFKTLGLFLKLVLAFCHWFIFVVIIFSERLTPMYIIVIVSCCSFHRCTHALLLQMQRSNQLSHGAMSESRPASAYYQPNLALETLQLHAVILREFHHFSPIGYLALQQQQHPDVNAI